MNSGSVLIKLVIIRSIFILFRILNIFFQCCLSYAILSAYTTLCPTVDYRAVSFFFSRIPHYYCIFFIFFYLFQFPIDGRNRSNNKNFPVDSAHHLSILHLKHILIQLPSDRSTTNIISFYSTLFLLTRILCKILFKFLYSFKDVRPIKVRIKKNSYYSFFSGKKSFLLMR